MIDADDFDPLDDILLSDEEPFGSNKTQVPQVTTILQNINNVPESRIKIENKRKKIFDELFGTDIESVSIVNGASNKEQSNFSPSELRENTLKTESNNGSSNNDIIKINQDNNVEAQNNRTEPKKNSYSWLGLSDENDSLVDTNVLDESNTSGKFKPINSVDSTSDRRNSKGGLLSKQSHFKSLNLDLDAELNDISVAEIEANDDHVDGKNLFFGKEAEFKQVSSNTNQTIDKSQNRPITTGSIKDANFETDTTYIPSFGISRPKTSFKSRDLSNTFDFHSEPILKRDPVTRKNPDNLPPWLSSRKISEPRIEKYTDYEEKPDNQINANSELQVNSEDVKDVYTKEKALVEEKKPDLLSEKTGFGDQAIGFEDLSSVFDLKKKQSELREAVKSQSELLRKHEKEIKETALKLISKQHNNINSLMQIITNETSADINSVSHSLDKTTDITTSGDTDLERISLQLHKQVRQLEQDNSILELKLQYMEQRVELEIHSLEDSFRHKLSLAEKRESQLKSEILAIEDEYRNKLLKQKESESELIQIHRERIEHIQKEREMDLKSIENLSRVIRDYPEQFRNKRKPMYTDAEISSREELLIKKEKQLTEFEDDLNRQKMTLESKKSNLEHKMEEFEINCVKSRLEIEQEKKYLRHSRSVLLQKEETWKQEKEREKQYLIDYQQELENAKDNLLRQEKTVAKQKFDLAAERSRLDAFMELEGIIPGQMTNVIQARVEVQAAIAEAKNLKLVLDNERKSLKNEEKKLKQKCWKLQEFEEELTLKARRMEHLAEQCNAKREEGLQALRKAKRVQDETNDKFEQISEKLIELHNKEETIMLERINISKERDLLNKYKSEISRLIALKGDSYTFPDKISFPQEFTFMNQNIIDPKCLILKLKAEQNSDKSFGKLLQIS